MMGLLKQACPIVSVQGFSGPVIQESNVEMTSNVSTVETRICWTHQLLFMSDRDKGLSKLAVKEVFPSHVEMNCGKHVMAMAKTYSIQYLDTVLE
jgi:hypothetical protein